MLKIYIKNIVTVNFFFIPLSHSKPISSNACLISLSYKEKLKIGTKQNLIPRPLSQHFEIRFGPNLNCQRPQLFNQHLI